jgi:oligopeptide transport system permease protein
MVLVLWAVVTIAFLLVWVAPGDPFVREKDLSPEIVQELKRKYKVDGPLWAQYTSYLGSLVHGDLRISMRYRDRSVNQILADGLPVSATLGAAAFILATVGGVALGTIAAIRQHTWIDGAAMFSALALISIPTFVTGPLLILIFAIYVGILPVGGWSSWSSIILPAITLAGPYTAYIARLMRSSLLEVLTQDFVRTARAKGLDETRTVYRHALKVAILPVVSFIGPLAASLLTGSLIVETLFNIPGAGPHYVNSILSKDRYLMMGMTIVYCGLLVFLNFVVDLVYMWLDRRIRLHE